MEAIRTEYKGIVFRSKSEAVFARCLDLSEKTRTWEYETDDGGGLHSWDFRIYVQSESDCICEYCGCRHKSLSVRPVLVEYKPSEPTQSYVTHLTEKVRPFVEKVTKDHGGPFMDSYIVYGNPWHGPQNPELCDCSYIIYPIFSNWAKWGWGNFNQAGDNGEAFLFSYRHDITDILGIDESITQEARRYRFDLK